MVSVYSTYNHENNHSNHGHNHNHHHSVKRKRKVNRNDPELLTRTAYVDASVAQQQIKKGKASGNKPALWLRSKIQTQLYQLGSNIQKNAGIFLFVGLLTLAIFTFSLKNATLETRVEKLWVQEGGRLQQELEYVEKSLGVGAGATNELIIQTPRRQTNSAGSILTPDALLAHLDVIKTASQVVVEKEDVTWQLKDLCYELTAPITDITVIDQILEKLFPCAIVTPLDCFWEGSKLLKTKEPVKIPWGNGKSGTQNIDWTKLNPQKLVSEMRPMFAEYPGVPGLDSFDEFMKMAGITSAYQEKPCLNPYDPECPDTAPNKETKQIPDIGAELTGGCYGFAARYMHWPEQLVVGGTIKNETGYIVRAKGLQSNIQVMGEKDLYDYYKDAYKVISIDWTPKVAEEILTEWQTKFSEKVANLVAEKKLDRKYEINAFSSSYTNEILRQFSEVDFVQLAIGGMLMLAYITVTLFNRRDLVKSQVGLGLSCVFQVLFTMAGALGCSAIIGLHFNALTTQTIPFLALGIGVNSMFLLIPTYADICANSEIPYEDKVGEVLKRCGVQVLCKDLSLIAAFGAGAIIPIPALRALSFQAALVFAFNSLAMLTLFPALLGIDLKRLSANRLDLFCCKKGQNSEDKINQISGNNDLLKESCQKWTLRYFVTNYWSVWIKKTPIKFLTLILASFLTCCGLYGIANIKQGLEMQEMVPNNSSAYEFFMSQKAYFPYYNMFAVTKHNFEYPTNQKTLYDYHNAFIRVPNIVKDDQGGLPEFWLPLFRNWLVRIQTAFDNDFAEGKIFECNQMAQGNEDGIYRCWHKNASDDGILGYKLLVQTGHVDTPVDESLLLRNRLVDSHGIISSSAFYNYLTAWYSNDAMAYTHSQASIVPQPKLWLHNAMDHGLLVPKSKPIAFARIPFYLSNLGDTEVMVEMINQVRAVCEQFSDKRDLPNFPTGFPFTFWEQYIHLRMWLMLALAAILAAAFIMTSMLMMSPWIGAVVVIVIGSVVVQLFGFMEFIGVNLSAVPAVITILAVGISLEVTLHIIYGFVTAIGNKNRRIMVSLKHMFEPVFHGAISTFLGIIMLAFSHFDFVVRYFFMVFTGLIVLTLFNGLIFLPVLLVLVGPPAELIPNDNSEAIDPPSPELGSCSKSKHHSSSSNNSTVRQNPLHKMSSASPSKLKIDNNRRNSSNLCQAKSRYNQSDLSLSTIAEESGSYASNTCHAEPSNNVFPMTSQSLNGTSITVEPNFTVEATAYPSNQALTNSIGSSRCSTLNPGNQGSTTVTANINCKVEVQLHAPSGSSGPHTASVSCANEAPTRPVSSRSRRIGASGAGGNGNRDNTTGSRDSLSGSSSVHSSLSDSLRSSLSSNDGDAGFSER